MKTKVKKLNEKLKPYLTVRAFDFYMFVIASFLVGYAFFIQHVELINPCPLCVVERFFTMLLAVFYFIGSIHRSHNKYWRVIFHLIGLIISLLGLFVSLRHVWLQYFTTQLQEGLCGPDLRYMLENLPLQQVLNLLFVGKGNCAVIDKVIFSLSLSAWALIFFLISTVVCAVAIFRKWRV